MAIATSTALIIAALAATAAGTYVSYTGQQEAAKTADRVSKYNAKTRENQAMQEDMEGREALKRQRLQGKAFMARQRAIIGGNGITVAGSPLEVLGQTKAQLDLEAADAARAIESRRRAGFAQAEGMRYEGRATAAGYRTQATGTLLSGAASMASMGAGYAG